MVLSFLFLQRRSKRNHVNGDEYDTGIMELPNGREYFATLSVLLSRVM